MLQFNREQAVVLVALCVFGPSLAYAQDNAFKTPAASGQVPLNLTCKGEGTIARDETSSATIESSNPLADNATVSSSRTVQEGFSGQADFDLSNGEGRIRLPSNLVSRLHRTTDGWYKIKNLKVSDRDVSGQAAIALILNPTFHIDRFTGEIEISSVEGVFSGQCRKFDPATEKALF